MRPSVYTYISSHQCSPQQVTVAHLALLPADVEVGAHLAFDLHEVVAGRSGSRALLGSGGRQLLHYHWLVLLLYYWLNVDHLLYLE